MTLKKCILTANDCYKKGTKMTGGKPTGIVVHSTGANNKTLKRYVQPLKTDPDYAEIIADIGTNLYNNHWNMSAAQMGRSVCVHAFIGVNAAGKIETYQTLPFDICCWGVGSGSKGSYNYNPTARVQFEICEDGLNDEAYFTAAMKEAQEFCAYLCKLYGFGVDKISSHHESYLAGYGGNHGDCDHWLKRFGKTMDWFRAEVQKLLDADQKPSTPATSQPATTFKAGDVVKITGSTYYSGKAIPSWVKAKNWIVKSVSGDRVVIDKSQDGANAICSPVKASSLALVSGGSAPVSSTLAVGDKVRMQAGAPVYGKTSTFASWVYNSTLYVREINGSRVVISTLKTGAVTGAVDKKYLTKI